MAEPCSDSATRRPWCEWPGVRARTCTTERAHSSRIAIAGVWQQTLTRWIPPGQRVPTGPPVHLPPSRDDRRSPAGTRGLHLRQEPQGDLYADASIRAYQNLHAMHTVCGNPGESRNLWPPAAELTHKPTPAWMCFFGTMCCFINNFRRVKFCNEMRPFESLPRLGKSTGLFSWEP